MVHILPSSNEFDIPDLLIGLQAEAITEPVVAWGSVARTMRIPGGTWHFYVDDARFRALLANTTPVANSGAAQTTEPNISIYDTTPRFEALAKIGAKRYVARLWQRAGLRIFVDLNVPELRFQDNLIGVPAGWRAFSTRGYASRPEDLLAEHALVRDRPGLLFLVVGGGKPIQDICRDLPGAVWVPSWHGTRKATS
jgi:hypothetical protein